MYINIWRDISISSEFFLLLQKKNMDMFSLQSMKENPVRTFAVVSVVIVIVVVIFLMLRPSTTPATSSSPVPTPPASSTPTPAPTPISSVSPTPDTTLVAYYPFDSDASDKSGNSKNATLMGNPNFITGQTGGAVSLNGNGQYIQLPSGILSSITNQFTISFWVFPNALSQWARFFDFGYGNQTKYMYFAINGGSTEFGRAIAGNDDTIRLNSTIPLKTGTWTHFVIVYNNGTATQYTNGVKAGQITFPFVFSDVTTSYIGKSQYPDPYLNGVIDEFKIYNVSKDPTQV
jgi:Concanavalin A-like lectin/glucanases superfamily